MKKILVISAFAVGMLLLVTVSSAVTGLFYKVSTHPLKPGDVVEQNVTIKKFYNLTAKFQKYNSSSDLTIRNSNTTIIFKDANFSEIQRIVGMNGNAVSSVVEKLSLDKIKFVSAYNLNNSVNTYEDLNNQPANLTYTALKATIIIKTNALAEGDAVIFGYVSDELTGQAVSGVNLFVNDGNILVAENSTVNGSYLLVFITNSAGKTFDLFVRDYEVSNF